MQDIPNLMQHIFQLLRDNLTLLVGTGVPALLLLLGKAMWNRLLAPPNLIFVETLYDTPNWLEGPPEYLHWIHIKVANKRGGRRWRRWLTTAKHTDGVILVQKDNEVIRSAGTVAFVGTYKDQDNPSPMHDFPPENSLPNVELKRFVALFMVLEEDTILHYDTHLGRQQKTPKGTHITTWEWLTQPNMRKPLPAGTYRVQVVLRCPKHGPWPSAWEVFEVHDE